MQEKPGKTHCRILVPLQEDLQADEQIGVTARQACPVTNDQGSLPTATAGASTGSSNCSSTSLPPLPRHLGFSRCSRFKWNDDTAAGDPDHDDAKATQRGAEMHSTGGFTRGSTFKWPIEANNELATIMPSPLRRLEINKHQPGQSRRRYKRWS